jgi:branched-chain amino acid aminotransferase
MIVAPDPDPSCIFVVERLTTPGAECYSKGVDVVTTQYVRNAPEVKAYAFVEKQEQIRSQIEPHIEEVLMVNGDGEILEGLSSNFFGVINPQIFTAEKQILEGITRKIVIDLIYDKGYPLIFNPVCISQLSELTECFITSTSRGILPVRRINQKIIGSGRPGDITRELANLYSNKILELIEPI